MGIVLLVLSLAVTVEALVEYGKSIAKWFLLGDWKTAITQLIAIVISITFCISTEADLYRALGVTFDWQIFGVVLTGIFASRGANFVSDFVHKLQNIETGNQIE